MSRDAYDVLDSLRDGGLSAVEVYVKEGRGRRYVRQEGTHQSQSRRERGWAVRAGDAHCSLFACGVGRPTPDWAWPGADGYALQLPGPSPVPEFLEPEGFDSPLVGEVEAREMVAGVSRSLDGELKGATIDLAILEDGSAESLLISSTGIECAWRHRSAMLRLEASWGRARVELERAARSVREFHPVSLAQQLADRLVVLAKGEAPDRDRGEMVLSPVVGVGLLTRLQPLFVGPAAAELTRRFVDRRGLLASSHLTIIDDGRLNGGLLAAPVDGEGVPTGRRVVLQDGASRLPILDWRGRTSGEVGPGSLQRFGWRDLPRLGPSHLFIEPPASAPPATELIAGVPRGYYLVEITGEPAIDWSTGRFAVPVCGFALDSGRARSPVAGAWLHGSIGSLLRGVQAVANDLTLLPRRGMIGSPSLLVSGLELRSTS